MPKHAHLPTMVRFVGNHVAKHLRPGRPRSSPCVSHELIGASFAAQRFCEHFRTASGALSQPCLGAPRCAVVAIQLWGSLHVRSCQPDPFAADVMHVREDCRDGANVARGSGSPCVNGKMLDKTLVDVIVGGEDLCSTLAGPILNLGMGRCHGSLLRELSYST